MLIATLASLFLTLAAIAMPSATFAQATPTADGSIEILGDVTTPGPITVAEIQTLPTETIDVTFTSGGEPQDHTYVGTSLLGVLEHIGLAFPEDAKNPWLSHYIVITANDGYQVILGGGELDPAFGNTAVYLAWEEDGAALEGTDGPLRLVVPGDTKGGRYVTGIVSIDILAVGEAAATPVA